MPDRELELLAVLHHGLRGHISERGWRFTPIQREAIPAILSGHDCVIEAPTAGGKTEAVLWPTLTRAAATRADSVRVLYLAPLRALLNNLEIRAQDYAALCNLEAFKWHGDVSHKEKLERLRRVPQVLLTTPESLEAILLRKTQWRQMFEHLQVVVIDEAHNFAGGDRGGHVLSLLARLERATSAPPQRIAVSATIGNPEAMLRWLVPMGRPSARRVNASSAGAREDYRVRFFDQDADSEDTPAEETGKWRHLDALDSDIRGLSDPSTRPSATKLIGPPHRSIVFAGSRRAAENYAKALTAFSRQVRRPDLKLHTHHSAVSKFYREEAERLIQISTEGGIDAIISTSTLELGIDIGELSAVIECGGLGSSSSFLQRVGRTGRREGKPRVFRGHCMNSEDLLLLTGTVSLGQKKQSEALFLPRRAFHLLAHQLMCLSLQQHGISATDAWDMLHDAHIFSGIEPEEYRQLVEHMISAGYLRREADVLVLSDEAEQKFLGAGWRRLFAVFDAAPMYDVLDGKTQVGTLDSAFVESLQPPFLFVLGARLWEAIKVDAKARTVIARRSRAGDAPKWKTFGGPDVPFETAQEVGRILHTEATPAFLDDAGVAELRSAQAGLKGVDWLPGFVLVSNSQSGRVFLRTYAGDRINRTLARYVSATLGCKATANYQVVEVVHPAKDSEHALERSLSVLEALSSETLSERELSRRLEESLKPYPFSPFAKCLPPGLLVSALAERALDVPGLLNLARRGQTRVLAPLSESRRLAERDCNSTDCR